MKRWKWRGGEEKTVLSENTKNLEKLKMAEPYITPYTKIKMDLNGTKAIK